MRTRCSDRLAAAGIAAALALLAWAAPGAATTHTIPPGRIAAARQLLQEAEKRATSVPAGKVRDAYLLGVASLRARAGDVDAGLRALAAIPPPYDFSMREAVQEIAAAQAVRGDVAGALTHVAALVHGPDADLALQAVATALARAGRQADALGVVAQARNPAAGDLALAAVATARVEAGDRPGALAALHSARGAVGPQSTMVEAYLLARDGKTSEAHGLGAGLADDTWLFGFVQRAHAQARAGDLAGARATAGRIPPGDFRESGQVAIACGQARGGDVAGALATARSLPEPARSLAHADIAIAQAQRGDAPGARRTTGLVQVPGNQARALEAVAGEAARAGNLTEALRVARSMAFDEYRRTAIKAVVEAQAGRGDVAGAMATIAALPPEEQPGLELAVALVRAEAGDAGPLLGLLPGQRTNPFADAVLLGAVTRLLRIPAEDPTSSPFWTYDVHPFR
jgi:hypothetical protein